MHTQGMLVNDQITGELCTGKQRKYCHAEVTVLKCYLVGIERGTKHKTEKRHVVA